MDISPKEWFLGICYFKRPGDLCLLSDHFSNFFFAKTLEEWLKQGAPEEIINPRFRREYFRFQRIRWLTGTPRGAIGEGREEIPSKIDLGHGITVPAGGGSLAPAYEPRIISEDESTVTLRNASGQTTKYIKDSLDRMPTFLDWPVKDRATWNEHKKRLDPLTSAILTIDETQRMVDEMFQAEKEYLKGFK